MITISIVVNIVFTENLDCICLILKSGDSRDMCENNDHAKRFSYIMFLHVIGLVVPTVKAIINYYWSTPKHKPKHKLEKWFIIPGDGVCPTYVMYVPYVHNTPIKELRRFSS